MSEALWFTSMCVKRSGSRRSKLDRHNFKGVFLGCMAIDQKIIYLDLNSGVVKLSHHVQLNEAWYLQSTRPPAAQLLYDLGILPEDNSLVNNSSAGDVICLAYSTPGSISPVEIPWPPLALESDYAKKWTVPAWSQHLHLPLQLLTEDLPRPS
jgi:hypothetical protein